MIAGHNIFAARPSIFVAALLAFLPAAPSRAAGFNCALARTPVEKMICADQNLGQADERLTTAYADALAAADRRERIALVDEERAWLTRRAQACGISFSFDAVEPSKIRCLRDATGSRSQVLEMWTEQKRVSSINTPDGSRTPYPDVWVRKMTTDRPPIEILDASDRRAHLGGRAYEVWFGTLDGAYKNPNMTEWYRYERTGFFSGRKIEGRYKDTFRPPQGSDLIEIGDGRKTPYIERRLSRGFMPTDFEVQGVGSNSGGESIARFSDGSVLRKIILKPIIEVEVPAYEAGLTVLRRETADHKAIWEREILVVDPDLASTFDRNYWGAWLLRDDTVLIATDSYVVRLRISDGFAPREKLGSDVRILEASAVEAIRQEALQESRRAGFSPDDLEFGGTFDKNLNRLLRERFFSKEPH